MPLKFRNFKIIYRRYAGLYFCICVDVNDNNLMYLEAIHNFVEVLNEYFHNVCELDLVFNFYKVNFKKKEMYQGYSIVKSMKLRLWILYYRVANRQLNFGINCLCFIARCIVW